MFKNYIDTTEFIPTKKWTQSKHTKTMIQIENKNIDWNRLFKILKLPDISVMDAKKFDDGYIVKIKYPKKLFGLGELIPLSFFIKTIKYMHPNIKNQINNLI